LPQTSKAFESKLPQLDRSKYEVGKKLNLLGFDTKTQSGILFDLGINLLQKGKKKKKRKEKNWGEIIRQTKYE